MNMRKVLFFVVSCLLMTACDLEDRLIAKAEEKYDESFKEVFGNIDPEHTWSMAENKSVSVDLDEPSRVKIYAKQGRTYYLVGDYENVSGNKELAFDAPRGCEDILVTVNGATYMKDGSRAVLCSSDPSEKVYAAKEGDEDGQYHYYTWEQIKGFYKDESHLPEDNNNSDRIKKDYLLVSNGETFTFSPTFWNGSYDHVYGIFYYDVNGKYTAPDGSKYNKIDFYQNKETYDDGRDIEHKELQYKKYHKGGKLTDEKTGEKYDWVNVKENCSLEPLYDKNNGKPKYDYAADDKMMRAQHFHIKLDDGIRFGFYLTTWYYNNNTNDWEDNVTYFSDSSLNEGLAKGHQAFGHIEIDGFTYIVVEDIPPTGSNDDKEPDYNDFVFTMKGVHEHVNETEPISYLYATEDLGGTDDFDFNDVVFSVSHVSGQPKATVKLMAAGGILPAYIYFENTQVGSEVHQAFGVDVKEMVNTNNGRLLTEKDYVDLGVVEVGKEWSHVAFTEKGNGFKVKVENNHKTFEVGTPGANNGEAPQMLILNRDWLWPTERTRIGCADADCADCAYPGFGQWGENYLNYSWVNTWNSNKVVNRDLTDEYPHVH